MNAAPQAWLRPVALAAVLAPLLLLATAASAQTAPIAELRSLFGLTVGQYNVSRPPANMRNLENGAVCGCTDYCRLDLSAGGTELAMLWAEQGDVCGPDLMTVSSGPDASGRTLLPPQLADIFTLGRDGILARYGRPNLESPIAGGQMTYCDVAGEIDESDPAAFAKAIVYYAFRFDGTRLVALRVGLGPVCPATVFTPAAG